MLIKRWGGGYKRRIHHFIRVELNSLKIEVKDKYHGADSKFFADHV